MLQFWYNISHGRSHHHYNHLTLDSFLNSFESLYISLNNANSNLFYYMVIKKNEIRFSILYFVLSYLYWRKHSGYNILTIYQYMCILNPIDWFSVYPRSLIIRWNYLYRDYFEVVAADNWTLESLVRLFRLVHQTISHQHLF